MDAQSLIIFLIVGAIAGWLAGQIMRGGGFGLVGEYHRRNYRCLPRRYAFSKARTSHRQWAPRGDNQRHDRCLYSALLG